MTNSREHEKREATDYRIPAGAVCENRAICWASETPGSEKVRRWVRGRAERHTSGHIA